MPTRKLIYKNTNSTTLPYHPPSPLQKSLLLPPTLPQIHPKHQYPKTNHPQPKQEIQRRRRIPRRRRVNNGAGDNGPDKRGRLPDDAEEAEEEEFVAAWSDFRDHGLGVAVPGAYEEAVAGLVELVFLSDL